MLTLTIFRHAKAVSDEGDLRDSERPLAPRGLKAAPAMGDWMAKHGIAPDLVLASPSVRTRQTAELALARLRARPELRFEKVLYLASPRTLLGIIRAAPASCRHLMLVGHNPGLHVLAVELAGAGPAAALHKLAEKLPTGAVVTIALEMAHWSEVRQAAGRLEHFMTPRMLDG